MVAMTAEEILKGKLAKPEIGKICWEIVLEAMQTYHEAKLKEELIDFLYWYDGTLEYTSMNSLKEVVDKYLNQKP